MRDQAERLRMLLEIASHRDGEWRELSMRLAAIDAAISKLRRDVLFLESASDDPIPHGLETSSASLGNRSRFVAGNVGHISKLNEHISNANAERAIVSELAAKKKTEADALRKLASKIETAIFIAEERREAKRNDEHSAAFFSRNNPPDEH